MLLTQERVASLNSAFLVLCQRSGCQRFPAVIGPANVAILDSKRLESYYHDCFVGDNLQSWVVPLLLAHTPVSASGRVYIVRTVSEL